MAVSNYDVVYSDGLTRRKQLSPEDAELLEKGKGVKSVKKSEVHDKQRRPAHNKGKEGDE